MDFNGDHLKGWVFLNLCKLYVKLAEHQFSSDMDIITWVLTYMKSDWAFFFVDQTLQYKSHYGHSMFLTWTEFWQKLIDEYIDKFKDLIDQVEYSEGLAIVTKFCGGLQQNIQDLIAQLLMGCLEDDKLQKWYIAILWVCH